MDMQKKARRLWKEMFLSIIVVLGAAGIANAQVNQGELQQNLGPVDFINYEGPYARVETREQIRQIGAGLGQAVRGGAARAGAQNRYFVIHSVSDPDGNRLDADIFGLGANAGVDHIRNLRTIIQGYLQEAYGYNQSDAALLAEYITIYNAVYRGDWAYFSERYKQPVLDLLTPEQAGISTRFDEWPGRTLMVIPLGIGGLSSIDTSAISDGRVVEELRKDDDMGIEQRQDLVDLKEREAAAAEEQAAAQREAARQEQQRIAQERAQVNQDRQNIAQERQNLAQDRQQAQDSGADTSNLDQREADLNQQEADADKKSEELDQREEQVAGQENDAQKQEDFAEQKTAEAQQDRESIAKDQQAMIDGTGAGQQTAGGQQGGVFGVVITRKDAALGNLVRLNPATGKELKRSPLDSVLARTLTLVNGKVLAVAGENKGNGAVRLIEVDSTSLEMAKQGDDDIHPGSLIWINGGNLYAITVNLADGTLNIGRFDVNLALQAKSKITIHPSASVSIQGNSLLTQRADGSAAVLNAATLTEAGK